MTKESKDIKCVTNWHSIEICIFGVLVFPKPPWRVGPNFKGLECPGWDVFVFLPLFNDTVEFLHAKVSLIKDKVVFLPWSDFTGRPGICKKNKMLNVGTSLVCTSKQARLLWQMTCQSAGRHIDSSASGPDLCLPFLSYLKGVVSGNDRVMYKSSLWLVTPR